MSTHIHKTDHTVSRGKALAKPAPQAPAPGRGNMKPAEIRPLIFAARRAFAAQNAAGLAETDFDVWRHEQVLVAVGKPGLTACDHEDFRPLLAHFQILAGEDAAAYGNLVTSGPASSATEDTHEARRQIAHSIAEILAAHIHLAESSIDQLVAESAQDWHRYSRSPYPGPDPEWIAGIRSRKAAIANGKGPITVGYLVFIARRKTRRPDLTLGRDWQTGLADRCTVRQLDQLRSTLINRIAALEGTGDRAQRNKSQRRPKPSADRS